MRTGLRTDQFAELRHIPGSVTGAVEASESATFAHKTNQAADHLRIGEDLSITAVHKYRVVIENLGIFKIIQVVAEDRLEGSRRICHLLDGKVRVCGGVVIISTRWSNIHDEKLSGPFGRCERLFGYGSFDLLLNIRGDAIRRGNGNQFRILINAVPIAGRTTLSNSSACRQSSAKAPRAVPGCGWVAMITCHGSTSSAMKRGFVPP